MTLIAALILSSPTLHGSQATVLNACFTFQEQANEVETGIRLYEKGDFPEAIRALKSAVKNRKDDIRAWHYLGLALSRIGKMDDARKAHEKAAIIGEHLVKKRVAGMTAKDGLYDLVLPVKFELGLAAESADSYIALSSKLNNSKATQWSGCSEMLHSLAELSEEFNDHHVYGPGDVTTKARIISKPVPQYTEEARRNQVSGTVILLVFLTADGNVKVAVPITYLPNGLSENAIDAARKIKFTPATINGKPVSQYLRVEYNFNIY